MYVSLDEEDLSTKETSGFQRTAARFMGFVLGEPELKKLTDDDSRFS
jgi:hypothetical protein